MGDTTNTPEYRIAAMKRFIEKSREGITEVEAKIQELGGEVEETVTVKEMFSFIRWREENQIVISKGQAWKKYQQYKKPKI